MKTYTLFIILLALDYNFSSPSLPVKKYRDLRRNIRLINHFLSYIIRNINIRQARERIVARIGYTNNPTAILLHILRLLKHLIRLA